MDEQYLPQLLSLLGGPVSEKPFSAADVVADDTPGSSHFVYSLVSRLDHISHRAREFRSKHHCTEQDAILLFRACLGRDGGGEREGRTVQNILDELLGSTEFNVRLLTNRWYKLSAKDFASRLGSLGPHALSLVSNSMLREDCRSHLVAFLLDAVGDRWDLLLEFGKRLEDVSRFEDAASLYSHLREVSSGIVKARAIYGLVRCVEHSQDLKDVYPVESRDDLVHYFPRLALQKAGGDLNLALAELSSEVADQISRLPSDAAALWDAASLAGVCLPGWYCREVIGTRRKSELEFSLPPTHDWPLRQTVEVHFGSTIKILASQGLPFQLKNRLVSAVQFLEHMNDVHGPLKQPNCSLSLGDEAARGDVIGFSSAFSETSLIPDPYFLDSSGYHNYKHSFEHGQAAWERRDPRAYWRGTDTGVFRYPDRLKAPRVRLTLLAKSEPGLLDAVISGVESRPDQGHSIEKYKELGIFGDFEPIERILGYQIQIDIDGNTNAWNGCFLKLLSGSPVLKVQSEFGFRQWFYDRLIPWKNYIPIPSDLSGMVDVLKFLRGKPELAKAIGYAGKVLATEMTMKSELEHCAKLLCRH